MRVSKKSAIYFTLQGLHAMYIFELSQVRTLQREQTRATA